ncbi:hypothetical protein BY458DRAFT_512546 [Sporodiniella umbellata]|nr:hypothetical protein BY458DRAFT_512546 [Sporodiniella umbellata]
MFKRKPAPKDSDSKKRKTSPSEEAWRLVFMDALEAHKNNKFEDAISLFARALSMQPDHLSILDGRSSCYERLSQYTLAMVDAKRMINVGPEDARGYLRACKILALQKRWKGAQKACDYGLSRASRQDSRYKALEEIKKRIERETADRIDFMNYLPFDVKAMIFSYMPFSRRMRCLAVSKGWRAFALNWRGMWRDLDFSDKKVGHLVVGRCLNQVQGRHVRRLAVSNVEQAQMDKILKLVIDNDCHYLDTLELKSCHPSRDLFIRTLRLMGKYITCINMNDSWGVSLLDMLDEPLKLCPDLKKLSIMHMHSVIEEQVFDEAMALKSVYQTNIQEVRMSVENMSDDSLVKVISHFPQLRFFELQTYTVLLNMLHHHLNTHCPQLESLVLTIHHSEGTIPDSDTRSRLKHFSVHATAALISARYLASFLASDRLETLALSSCSAIGPTLCRVALFPGALKNIRTLHLTNTLDLNEEDLAIILPACPDLEELKITGSQGVTDGLMELLPANKIKRIDFSLSTRLTGTGLQQLVKKQGDQLEKLIINNCSNIDYATVSWAIETLGKQVVECRHTVKRR